MIAPLPRPVEPAQVPERRPTPVVNTAKTKPVTVYTEPEKWEHPVMYGQHVLTVLKAAGVPVVGVLWPTHVREGTLTVSAPDLVDGRVEWHWIPE